MSDHTDDEELTIGAFGGDRVTADELAGRLDGPSPAGGTRQTMDRLAERGLARPVPFDPDSGVWELSLRGEVELLRLFGADGAPPGSCPLEANHPPHRYRGRPGGYHVCPGVNHDHELFCCVEHDHHVLPHRGCAMRSEHEP
jgi:hypothetical protein